jgi:predicted DNA-binding protein (UPF0251 family)
VRRGSRHNLTRGEWRPIARLYAPRGEQLPQARLTADDVRAIRASYGPRTAQELASHYRVHRRTIEKIVRWETWSHVR